MDLKNIHNPRLKHIYNDEMGELVKSFNDCKKILDSRTYRLEILICLFTAVQMKKFVYVQFLSQLDHIADKIINNLRRLGRSELIAEYIRREEEVQLKKGRKKQITKNINQTTPQDPASAKLAESLKGGNKNKVTPMKDEDSNGG